jgi:hypothetical protein
MKHLILAFSIFILCSCGSAASNDTDGIKLNALIVDGQNNHSVWPKSTAMTNPRQGFFDDSVVLIG